TVDVDPDAPADVIGDEPVWHVGPEGERVVGWITSGGYAHYSAVSLAMGYIPTELAAPTDEAGGRFEIEIIGRRRPAKLQHGPVLDPQGLRMRA
ncbi:MAG: dimethylglycine dehydrogenase, partial [Acidimicrobiaceae bacterium]